MAGNAQLLHSSTLTGWMSYPNPSLRAFGIISDHYSKAKNKIIAGIFQTPKRCWVTVSGFVKEELEKM